MGQPVVADILSHFDSYCILIIALYCHVVVETLKSLMDIVRMGVLGLNLMQKVKELTG